MDILDSFSGPVDRQAALSPASPVPNSPGVYLWFFQDIPPHVPVAGCLTFNGYTLLYAGISPDQRTRPKSRQNLSRRIRYHLKGNAAGSTLRRTLGILLADKSGFALRRVGSSGRMTFTHAGEQWLDAWLDMNALVFWHEHPEPWVLERELLHRLSCPLNLRDNSHHSFRATLRESRAKAISVARQMPVAEEIGQRRTLPLESGFKSA